MFKSIKTRFTVYLSIILLLLLTLFSSTTYTIAKRDASDTAHEILRMLTIDGANQFVQGRDMEAKELARYLMRKYQIDPVHVAIEKIDTATKTSVYSSISDAEAALYFPHSKSAHSHADIEYADVNDFKVSSMVVGHNGSVKSYLQIALEPLYHKIFLENLYKTLLITSIGIFLFFLTATQMLFHRILAPIHRVIKKVRKASQQRTVYIDTRGIPREIEELVQTFNKLLDDLYDSFEKVSNFSSDASHELKTPLTVIRGELEVTMKKERSAQEYQTVMRTVLEETIHMQNVIEDLLFIAKSDKKSIEASFEQTYLDEVITEAIASVEKLADARGVTIELLDLEPIAIFANAALMRIVFVNLLKNAVLYSHRGERVEVTTHSDGIHAHVMITDHGQGITADALPRIFERFYHSNRKEEKNYSSFMGSTGLGLAIVKNIIDLHRYKIEAQSSVGEGTVITIIMPTEEAKEDLTKD